MTADPDALEQRLLRAYQEQLRYYDRALAILGQQGAAEPEASAKDLSNSLAHASGSAIGSASGSARGSALSSAADDLHVTLREVMAVDAAMADDKAAWRLSGARPAPELSALLARLASKIAILAAWTHQHVAELEAGKAQLLPAIDAFIQKRRMLQAYGKYGDRQAHVTHTT